MTLLGLIPPGLILWLEAHGHWAATILTIVLSGFCAAHAALHKRDARSAIGWIGLILLVPVLGSVLYVLLGINRVRRGALELFGEERLREAAAARKPAPDPDLGALTPLSRLIGRETGRPLHAGCRITPLFGGDRAYPRMIEAIEEARSSVTLASYHFSDDPLGSRFVEALIAARGRGVQVRVLFDHTKLMLVDGEWTLLGSTNWDARSLRLHFEFCVECYDAPLTRRLERRAAALMRVSIPATREALLGAPLWERLRNASARLLSPYL